MQYDFSYLKHICVFRTTVPSGKRSFREHYHTECEISLILCGEGTYLVNEKPYSFRKGDILLFGSDEVHCITEVSSGQKFDMLTVKFEPELLWNSGDIDTSVLLKLFFNRNDSFSNRIERDNPAIKSIRDIIIEIEEELREKTEGYELKVKINLYSALLIILRCFNYVNGDTVNPAKMNNLRQLSAAMDYINQNLTMPLTLEEIAAKATMSRAYFSTIFKKYNGISPWDYITIKRIEKSIDLIKTTDMTKYEIAESCGFNSMSNFYKQFNKITGKSPNDYLK